MAGRPRIIDDLAGMAGGAFSALIGIREELEALVRARIDETIRRLDLVRREEIEALAELAANARAGQETAETRLAAVTQRLGEVTERLENLESRLTPPAAPADPAALEGGGGSGT